MLGELSQLSRVHEYEKEYVVFVARRPDKDQLEAWKREVILADGYKTAQPDVRLKRVQGKGTWVRVVTTEGRKRQIREICNQLGIPVVRILRIRIGSLRLRNLKPREWRYLTTKEIDDLKQTVQA